MPLLLYQLSHQFLDSIESKCLFTETPSEWSWEGLVTHFQEACCRGTLLRPKRIDILHRFAQHSICLSPPTSIGWMSPGFLTFGYIHDISMGKEQINSINDSCSLCTHYASWMNMSRMNIFQRQSSYSAFPKSEDLYGSQLLV